MANHSKSIAFASTSVLIGLVAALLILEIILRLFPVNEGLRVLPVNEQNPILRFTPNRVSTWSRGWNFVIVNRVRTNNYGFVSDVDYDPQGTTPLLVIIGDSYVEATMVPYGQTVAGTVKNRLRLQFRVYSFGSSGSALSQYLAYCEYVRENFHPVAVIIVIVDNDFDESLLKYKSAPGFHYFVKSGDGNLVLKRIDFEVTIPRALVSRSALGMYLATNLKAQYLWDHFKEFLSFNVPETSQYVSDTAAGVDPARVSDSQQAIDAFLKMLPSLCGLDASRIGLILDAMRETVYDPDRIRIVHGSFFDVMRRYLIDGAQTRGFEVIDMQEIFTEHYKHHGQRFEFPTDEHWNAIGHAVVANAVQHSKLYRTIVGLIPEKDER